MERGKLGSAPTTANRGCGACGNITPTVSASGVFQDSAKLERAKFRAAHSPLPVGGGFEVIILVYSKIVESKVEILGGRTRRLNERRGASLIYRGQCIHEGYRIVVKLSQLPRCTSLP